MVTNSRMPDQTVRRRVCESCGHAWFTVELVVPSYAVGWSARCLRKPVLRVPLELEAEHVRVPVSHEEAGDQLEQCRLNRERQAAKADKRHRL